MLNLLERTGLAEGGAQMVLAEAERCGSSAKELHASLMDVVSRGHEIPKVSITIIFGLWALSKNPTMIVRTGLWVH